MWQKVASQCLSRKYLFKALISKFFPLWKMKNDKNMKNSNRQDGETSFREFYPNWCLCHMLHWDDLNWTRAITDTVYKSPTEAGTWGLGFETQSLSVINKKFTSNVLISGIWHAVWKLNELNELFTPRSFFYRVGQSVWPNNNKNVKCKHLIVYLIINTINKHWVGVWTSITIGY